MQRSYFLIDFFLTSVWHAFSLTFIFFLLLYFTCAGIALGLAKLNGLRFKISQSEYSTIQILKEIRLSILSISIFSFQSIFIQQALLHSWAVIDYTFTPLRFILEATALFFWNEMHFYGIHWVLHRKWWFRHVHHIHHQSHNPTPFSVYSFSWVEAFLLGSVIFLPLFIHTFQVTSLLALPVMSIVLNVIGHSNYDCFSHKNLNHLLRASFRHSLHHSKVTGNYGFQLSIFDRLFKTNINP